MSSTPSSSRTAPRELDEDRRLAEQRRRGRELYAAVDAWLGAQALDPRLAARVRLRVLKGGEPGVIDTPAELALCLAESLGAPQDERRRLGIAAALYWAAADSADDVDDDDVSGGLHGGDGPAPTANDACALLFLAQRALLEWRPDAAMAGVRFGLAMAAGQAADLASTGRPEATDALAIAKGKAGAELALFFTWAGLAAGDESGDLAALGERYGTALQIFSDAADLYVKPMSDDFVAGKWTLPLARFRGEAPEAALLEALDRTRPDVQARMRWATAESTRRALADQATLVTSAWENVRERCPDPRPFDDAVAWLAALLETVDEAVAELPEPPAPPSRAIDEVMAAGAGYLTAHDFAEEHRWGLFDKPIVAGNLFSTLLKAAALRAAGDAWRPSFERLLALRDADGWRYFPGHAEIPPDADDAGLLLGHFGDVLAAGLRDETAEQLTHAFDGEGIHTWMGKAAGEVHWQGDDCPATLANACWGLMQIGQERRIPGPVWRRLLREAEHGAYESPFYVAGPTRFFLHRALAKAVLAGALRTVETEAARRRLEGELHAERRIGGGFEGDTLADACAALAALQWGLRIPPTWADHLADRQEIDGAWPADPCFRTPGVNFRRYVWGDRGLTASFALLALAAVRAVQP